MIRRAPLFLFLLLTLEAFSQKVPVNVITSGGPGKPGWQVLDENYIQVFAGSELFPQDTVLFSLESDRRYFLYLSVSNIAVADSVLLRLEIDNEPLLRISPDYPAGDHFIPFVTGVRTPVAKITGGTTASITDFPWQVYIVAGGSACGGSIIGPNWILTAAHCVREDDGTTVPPSGVLVRTGLENPGNSQDGARYTAAEVIVHENYNTTTLANDLALIRLRDNITTPNASPIKLVTSTDVSYGATDPGVMTWVTGWGYTSVSPVTQATSLQKVQLPIITNEQARTVWRSIPPTVIMAGFLNGNKDACNGDSGGPMVVPVVGEYKLAGLVSWGSEQCNTYGAYTRVSLFVDWIISKTGLPLNYRPPAPSGDTLVCRGSQPVQYSMSVPGSFDSYEWRLVPASAGSVSGTRTSATVDWNSSFTGVASLIFRITSNGQLSDWSRLDIRVVENTSIVDFSADTTVCEGEPVALKVQAVAYRPVYRWYRNGNLVKSGPENQLFFFSSVPGNSGNYRVEVSAVCGTVSSSLALLTVHPKTEILSVSPEQSVPFGSTATLQAGVSGHELTFTWQKEGVAIQGADDPVIVIPGADAKDIGNYTLVAKGTCGTVTSDSIWLFVEGGSGTGGPDVFIWPSITSDFVSVAVSNEDPYSVRIYSTTGRLLRTITELRYTNKLNISWLPRGIYIINVEGRGFSSSIKLIKPS